MKIDNSLYDFKHSDVSFIGLPRISSKTPNPLSEKSADLLRFALNNKDDYDLLTQKNVFDKLKINDQGNLEKFDIKEYNNQKLFIFGGDHSITNEVTNTLMYKFKNLHVIVFDAHLDVRPEGEANATFLRKVIERMPKEQVHLVGQRVSSKEEFDYIKTKRIKVQPDLDLTNKNIYISFDIDVIDNIFVPSCSTPEPFGKDLQYYNDLLVKLVKNNNLIGIDFVEFAGKEYDITYSNIASIIMNLLKTFLKS